MTFRGWPDEAFEFYAELEMHNDRAWWQAHRDVYDRAVKAPFEALVEAVEDEFGAMHIFRPNRDVRFSKDKSPYKTAGAAMAESEGGSAYYVQVSAEGLLAGAGMHHMATDQLGLFRAALVEDTPGTTIADVVDDLMAAGYEIGAIDELKTAPRGWPKGHPLTSLARRKGLVMSRAFSRAKWQSTAKALDRITGVWREAGPIVAWLDTFVGPSTIPPRQG